MSVEERRSFYGQLLLQVERWVKRIQRGSLGHSEKHAMLEWLPKFETDLKTVCAADDYIALFEIIRTTFKHRPGCEKQLFLLVYPYMFDNADIEFPKQKFDRIDLN